MKIVILDGYTLNPGDLSWDGMKALGEFTVYDRTPAELVVERSKDAEIIYTNKTPLNKAIFSQLPKLKYIGVLATGYNVVDVNAAKNHGIIVTNIPAYGTKSVAQMTFALLLELCHHVQEHSTAVHNGDWVNSRDFCFCNYPLTELSGKTIGIIGFGRIGQQVAEIAYAFGLKVIGCATHKNPEYSHDNFSWGELDELLGKADIVSLHCPLSPATTGIINKDTIAKMKKSAFLINTSRGPLIDETALAEALNYGIIAGAGLDVLSAEPPKPENPLLNAKNCIITPHIAWATKEARSRLMDIAVQNLNSFLQGNPVNVVNK
jgi:glycerate dehydrogenase